MASKAQNNKTQTYAKVTKQPRAKAGGTEDAANGASAPAVNVVVKHRNRYGCRTTEYMPPGSTKVGLSKENQPSKTVMEIHYSLSHDASRYLSEAAPGIAFVSIGSGCHDHPVAHTLRRVVWDQIMAGLKPGEKVADVYGDPQYNEGFNKRQMGRDNAIKVHTFCKIISPKDAVRSIRWGPKVKGTGTDAVTRWEDCSHYDMYRNEENRKKFSKYDVFVLNHAGYYFTKAEVSRLVNLNPGSRLVMTLHRHDGESGVLNNGEQTWVKYKDSQGKTMVRQTNVLTGETYEHADSMQWFTDFQYADEFGGMAWTANLGAPEHYIVTFTSCPNTIIRPECWLGGQVVIFNEQGERGEGATVIPSAPPSYEDLVVELDVGKILQVKNGPGKLKILIKHKSLYETLCAFMINKPRNLSVLKDLTSKANREAGNSTLLGGGKKVDIPAKELSECIMAAFLANMKHEGTLVHAVSNSGASAYNAALKGNAFTGGTAHSMVKDGLRALILGKTVLKSGDTVESVLKVLDEWL